MPDPERSHIEIKGLTARFYDLLISLATLGSWNRLIRRFIRDIDLQPGETVADFGAGTGKIAAEFLSSQPELKVYLIDIGEEMLRQCRKRFQDDSRVIILKRSILEPFQLPEKADRIILSFVLHGFEPDEQEVIIKNVQNNLKEEGRFILLDWNEFDLSQAPRYLRFFFYHFECPIAQDFIKVNWKKRLETFNLHTVQEKYYFQRHIRLLQLKTKEG